MTTPAGGYLPPSYPRSSAPQTPAQRRSAQRRLAAELKATRENRAGGYQRGAAGQAYNRELRRIRETEPVGTSYRTAGGTEWFMNVYGQIIEYPPSQTLDTLRGTGGLEDMIAEWWAYRFIEHTSGNPRGGTSVKFEVDVSRLIADSVSWTDDIRIAVVRMGFEAFRDDISRRTIEYNQLDAATKQYAPLPWGWYHGGGKQI